MVCAGLATLWAYGRKIDDDLENDQKTPKDAKDAKDNIVFFNYAQQLLLDWDEEKPFDEGQRQDLECFISNVLLYQRADMHLAKGSIAAVVIDNYDQMNLASTLETVDGKRPVEVFKQPSTPMTKEMIADRFKQLIKPKSIIFIDFPTGDSGHVVSVYQNIADGKIYFYDPNTGEKVVNDIEELRDVFWEASNPSQYRKGFGFIKLSDFDLRKNAVRVFRLPGDPEHQYPTPEENKITAEEFLNLFQARANLSQNIYDDEDYRSFADCLGYDQVLKILRQDSVGQDIKKALIGRIINQTR